MAETYTEQERAWGILYARLEKILRRFGKSDGFGHADYWLLDDNWGPKQHKVHINKLKMLAPPIVKQLQSALKNFPDWEIVAAVGLDGAGESWPEMGLKIRADGIVDELQRQYFPKQYQGLRYEGSRQGQS